MAFGTVTGVIGLLNLSRQLINDICEQYRRVKKVPGKCNRAKMVSVTRLLLWYVKSLYHGSLVTCDTLLKNDVVIRRAITR